MAKRIMRAFKIEELSMVDKPAQEGAEIKLAKRNDDTEKANSMSFEQIVTDIRNSEHCSGRAAMEKARLQHPEAFEAYRKLGSTVAKTERTSGPMKKSADQEQFEGRARQIAKAEGIKLGHAMSLARQRFPDAFQKAYG